MRSLQKNKTYFCLGLMSGTSMDGIDVALIETDGASFVRSCASSFFPYTASFQRDLKKIERLMNATQGNISELHNADRSFFEDCIAESTKLHAEAASELIENHQLNLSELALVGYHGQTLYHAPQAKKTLQAGNPQQLADALHLPVVADFRTYDVQQGGQGAPLAPLYHWALVEHHGLAPAVVVNSGGIANVTFIPNDDPQQMLAADVGPANVLLDRFVRERTKEQHFFDRDGQWALAGKVNEQALQTLFTDALPSGFLEKMPPKSLDSYDCTLPPSLKNLSLEDGLATLCAFSAECIAHALDWGIPAHSRWILTGGGWHNPANLAALKHALEKKVGHPGQILLAQQVGWEQDALEAEAFAYLGLRVLLELPISFPKTTGVATPLTGGKVFYPSVKEHKSHTPLS